LAAKRASLDNGISTASTKKVAFAALHHRDYRRYFFVIMMSQMGDNIEHVISYWLLFQKFHSPVLGGFAVISHWTPFLFFSVYFGALADRHDCRRVIQTAQCMYAAVSLTWGILFITDTIQVWHACVLLVIHGMAGVLGAPGSQLIIHDIVGREYLQSAVRLNSTGRNLAVLFGPAVGGVVGLSRRTTRQCRGWRLAVSGRGGGASCCDQARPLSRRRSAARRCFSLDLP